MTSTRIGPAVAGVLLIGSVLGCSGGGDPTCTGAATVKLSDVQSSIFTPSCAIPACHSGETPAESLDLTDGAAYKAAVNVRSILDPSKLIVDPSNAAQSEMYILVHNGVMPQIGDSLPTAQQTMIHDWICGGAVNDCPNGACGTTGSTGTTGTN